VKQTVKVGGREVELDLLVKEEVATTIEQAISGYLRPTSPRRDEDGVLAPASGDVMITLPPVPRGMEVIYTRVVLEAPGSAFTPAAPYNAAGGYTALLRDQELLDFISNVAGAAGGGGIPYRWTWSTSYGIRFRDGEALSALIHIPPAVGTALVLRADGFLSPIDEKSPGGVLLPGA
jgi:hypothetical protein